MPPAAVKTVRDLLHWQYAKLIARSAGYDKNYGFIMERFKKLQSGEVNWSGSIQGVHQGERCDRRVYLLRQ